MIHLTIRRKGGPESGWYSPPKGTHTGKKHRAVGSGKAGVGVIKPAYMKGTTHSAEDVGHKMISEIMADDRLHKLAIAACADGSIDDVANVEWILTSAIPGFVDVLGEVNPDSAFGEYVVTGKTGSAIHSLLNQLWDDYERAISEKGYRQDIRDPSKLTDARRAWERKYYGKVVGGFQEGEAFADKEIGDYLRQRVRGITITEPSKVGK